MGESRIRNFLRPPPSRQGHIFYAPPPFFFLKDGYFFRPPPPLSVWLKRQAPVFKLLQDFLCTYPLSMAKAFPIPPFCMGKTSLSPTPSCFVPPPPPAPCN